MEPLKPRPSPVNPDAHATPVLTERGHESGWVVLQASRMEDLASLIHQWMDSHPAPPLQDNPVLVPSNGLAEWFKIESARSWGIFAGLQVELPGRWMWRLAQKALGESLATRTLVDKPVLAWNLAARLSQLPPDLLSPLGLAPPIEGQAVSRGVLGVCHHVADLLDAYQIHRPDWLDDWQSGQNILKLRWGESDSIPIPENHRWQARLWRWWWEHRNTQESAQAPVSPARLTRSELHRLVLQRLRQGDEQAWAAVPSRIVLLGCTQLPPSMLELLWVLSQRRPVLMAVFNPCDVQWIDVSRGPSTGQPLLSAWGRQLQDFLSQLDRFESHRSAAPARIDLESTEAAHSALQRLQQAIRLNEPVEETAQAVAPDGPDSTIRLDDGSIRFHRVHTPMREIEVLHDTLLHALTATPQRDRLQAREVVVMVPDLADYIAPIQSVFGRFKPGDERWIPWGITDRPQGSVEGPAAWLDWLIGFPAQRCTLSDLERLLHTPSVQRRWQLDPDAVQKLIDWIGASGIRWGLNHRHRQVLGLPQAGHLHTWRFGIERMLVGYAAGLHPRTDLLPIEPLLSVHGLQAQSVGHLSALVRRLEAWMEESTQAATVAHWCHRLRHLFQDLFDPVDDAEQAELLRIDALLTRWLQQTEAAGFELMLDASAMRDSVARLHTEPPERGRFFSGGVTFCTLMPLRTVPFRMVALLGMTEGDYPRPVNRVPGDLMADPKLARAGDRSRRLDDRQLMLDALLSARDTLLVSWIGRRVSDHEPQPPSTLVGQLRDTLAAVWGHEALARVTVDHPLQPFSPRYLQAGELPPTYAREWWEPTVDERRHSSPAQPGPVIKTAQTTESEDWTSWLRDPVGCYQAHRWGVKWSRSRLLTPDDEPMRLQGLTSWAVWKALVQQMQPSQGIPVQIDAPTWMERLRRQGLLPPGAPGRWEAQQLMHRLNQMAHVLVQARDNPTGVRVELWPSRLGARSGWRIERGVAAWFEQTAEAAAGRRYDLCLLGPDGCVRATPYEPAQAQAVLKDIQTCIVHFQQAPQAPATAPELIAAAFGSPASHPAALDEHAKRDAAWRRSFGMAGDWAWHSQAPGHAVSQWLHDTQALYGAYWQWCGEHTCFEPDDALLEPTPHELDA